MLKILRNFWKLATALQEGMEDYFRGSSRFSLSIRRLVPGAWLVIVSPRAAVPLAPANQRARLVARETSYLVRAGRHSTRVPRLNNNALDIRRSSQGDNRISNFLTQTLKVIFNCDRSYHRIGYLEMIHK